MSDSFDDYLAWAARQCCYKCGAKASDRERGPDGGIVGKWWTTETDCGCPDVAGKSDVGVRTKLLADGLRKVW